MKKVVFESVGNVLLFVLMGLAFMFPFSRYEGGATADGFSLSVHLSPLMAVFVVFLVLYPIARAVFVRRSGLHASTRDNLELAADDERELQITGRALENRVPGAHDVPDRGPGRAGRRPVPLRNLPGRRRSRVPHGRGNHRRHPRCRECFVLHPVVPRVPEVRGGPPPGATLAASGRSSGVSTLQAPKSPCSRHPCPRARRHAEARRLNVIGNLSSLPGSS